MINWTAYGFKEMEDDDGICYNRQDFPFDIWELNGYLYMSAGLRAIVNTSRIKATNENLELLLRAFQLPLKPLKNEVR